MNEAQMIISEQQEQLAIYRQEVAVSKTNMEALKVRDLVVVVITTGFAVYNTPPLLFVIRNVSENWFVEFPGRSIALVGTDYFKQEYHLLCNRLMLIESRIFICQAYL